MLQMASGVIFVEIQDIGEMRGLLDNNWNLRLADMLCRVVTHVPLRSTQHLARRTP